jgi:hypothetical protein
MTETYSFRILVIEVYLELGVWNLEFHNNQIQDELKFKTGADEFMTPVAQFTSIPGRDRSYWLWQD